MTELLQEIISRLWTTSEHAEWTPKTDVIALSDVQRWMASSDIENSWSHTPTSGQPTIPH